MLMMFTAISGDNVRVTKLCRLFPTLPMLTATHHQTAPQTNFPPSVKGTPSLSQTHGLHEKSVTLTSNR